MKPVDQMTNDEINEFLAIEVMGFNKFESQFANYWCNEHGKFIAWCTPSKHNSDNWDPSNNENGHTDCWTAESRMRELGCLENYLWNLMAIIEKDMGYDWEIALGLGTFEFYGGKSNDKDYIDSEVFLFDITHAKPKQRCLAIVAAVKGNGDKKDG